jgi:Flp pilus assembly protein TadD
MQHADATSVLGDFADREVTYFDETARFFRRGDAFFVETLDAAGKAAEYPIAYTFGVEPIQQYLVEFPGGRLQALPWLWDTRPETDGGRRWVHLYPDEYIAPGDGLHWTGRRQNWNYMCAECHSTNVVVGYDTTTDTFDTRYDEVSVGCEACHGPGSDHVRLANEGDSSGDFGLVIDLDDHAGATWAMNPDTGIAALTEPALERPRQPEACGRCHARRGVLDEPYRYGQPLADTHRVSLLGGGLYFPDGQIRDEVYVYGSFLQSRMYQAGVTCSDCHEPHSATLITGPDPNAVCAQCHSPSVFAVESHSGHTAEAAGCVDCHMAARTYMVVDDRRDHGFRVPRPELAARTGSPDPCTGCHSDQSPAWAEAALADDGRDSDRPEFATALAASNAGHANAELLAVIGNSRLPGIARGTALAALAAPFTEADLKALVAALDAPDPLVRIGALETLNGFAPEEKAQVGAPLLGDPIMSVRIEAAIALADAFDYLDADGRRAFNEAASEFRRSRLLTASQSDSLVSLAAFERQLGNSDQARAAFERALHVDPTWSLVRLNYADFLRQEGEDSLGESILREGLEITPEDANLQHALGLLLVRQQRPDEGLFFLEEAARLAPDNPRYAYVLGVAFNSMNRPDAALETLAAAYQRHPADFDLGWAYATFLANRGDAERAREVVADMQKRFADNAQLDALLRQLSATP